MHKRVSILAALFLAISAMTIYASSGGSSEAKPQQRDFVIAGSDGYGTQECLASQSNCGRIVADAWCEAKGFKAALAYRKLDADEITGSTGTSARGKPIENFLISCKN
jgi:hypothetical protein